MKEVRFRLRDADYDVLRQISKSHGYSSVNEFVKTMVIKMIENRIVIDHMDWNNLLNKIDHLQRRIENLENKVIELESKVNDIRNKLKGTLIFKAR